MTVSPLGRSSPTLPPPAAPRPASEPLRIALVGNPNTGKTTLFNRLCGLRAKTANFPGTTTDARIGRTQLPAAAQDAGATTVADPTPVEIIDLPGVYGLNLDLPESRVCGDALRGAGLYRQPDAAVVVVDATNLVRNLRLVAELLAIGLPTVVALNMIDLAQRRGLTIDPARLADQLGCPVIPVIARRGVGVEALRATIGRLLTEPAGRRQVVPPRPDPGAIAFEAWAERVVAESIGGAAAIGSGGDSLTERLDQAFTHPVLGVAVFSGVMASLFWAIFSLATVPMDLIEASFETLGGWLAAALPAGPIRDLVVEGIIGGVAGTVVFLPQIWLLFFLISLLEDTGYLARAAFVMDRVLCRFGLPGHAFVPLLSSHACAIPGILSSRLIPDRRDRLATILVAPFMSCSARMPVYVLLTGMLFRDRPLLGGLAFAGCYLLGAAAALASALLARRSLLRGRSRPMMLELPTYKLPSLRTGLFVAYDQGKTFLHKAGTVILGICMVMWWLSAYPTSAPPAEALALRQAAAAATSTAPERAAELTTQADFLTARHEQAGSFAGRIGRAVQPVFAPLGYDWQLTVGVLTSFVAREVFVSTMAVLLVGDGEADPGEQGVIERIQAARRDDGTPVFTPASAASLLIFFVLAMQCLPTLVVTRRETGSWRWAGLQLAWMTGLAYAGAFVTYHGLHLLGVA